MIEIMRSFSKSRIFGSSDEEQSQPEDLNAEALPFPETEESESTLIKTVGWVSAGLGAVALGLIIGRELRQRYKFNRRTPYDFYSHSGDEQQGADFGLGV
jgi:hypothetical protein